MADHDSTCEATHTAVEAAWERVGAVDPMLQVPVINPMFMGAPPWPNTRQAYRRVVCEAGVLRASDGLADPFDAEMWDEAPSINGFELEVYAIGPESPRANDDGDEQDWVLAIVQQLAMQAAHSMQLADIIAQHGVISMELWDVPIPAAHASRFVNEEGRVGVLLGLTHEETVPTWVDGPLSRIRLLNAKLLTLDELAMVVERGAEGRAELEEKLTAAGEVLVSSLERASVA